MSIRAMRENARVFQERIDSPVKHVKAYDGHYVNVRHVDSYENLTACNLTGPEVC